MYLIYKITCTVSGKSYIGLTKDLALRLNRHKLPSSDCCGIRNAIQKYGWDQFVVETLLDNLSLEEANKAEERLIGEHATLTPTGYNLQTGGDHRILSEKSRKQISKTLTGRPRPQSVIDKMAAAHRGKPLSEQHKANIALTRLRGIPRSAEVRTKISAAQVGRKATPEAIERMKKSTNKKQESPYQINIAKV